MEDVLGKKKLEVGPKIYSFSIYNQHSMYGPGTNLSPKDTAVHNRGKKKKSLCSHLNVSGRGH